MTLTRLHVDAHHTGRRLALAQGDHRPAGPRAPQVPRDCGRGRQQDQREEVVQPAGIDRDGAQVQDLARREVERPELDGRERAALRAAGQPGRIEEHVLRDEDEAERHDREVKAAQAQGDRPEQRTEDPGHDARPPGSRGTR